MLNFISNISIAYSPILINEACKTWDSCKNIYEKYKTQENFSDEDLAKIIGFAAKIFGSIALYQLARKALNIARNQTIYLFDLPFIAKDFLLAADCFQIANNLLFAYDERAREALCSNSFSKFYQKLAFRIEKFKNIYEDYIASATENTENTQLKRIIKIMAKNTYTLAPFTYTLESLISNG